MKLVLGTAALGLPYGIPEAVGATPSLLPEPRATAVIEAALAGGITRFDTAPAYGCAEQRLGTALAGRGQVWTKLGHDRAWEQVDESLARSCRHLRRDRLDLLQIHNWSPGSVPDEVLARLAADRRVGGIGCSTYGVDDAAAAVRDGRFTMVQVEWNLLNQTVVETIGDEARARGVAIAVRSVLLQGVLTSRPLPAQLAGLTSAKEDARRLADGFGLSISGLALAAAVSHPAVSAVLIGCDDPQQVVEALAAQARQVPLASLRRLHVGGPLTDPRAWVSP